MKKRTLGVLLAIVVLLVVVIPVAAVKDGEPDGESHPYVGLMVALNDNDDPLWRCSGTLISPKLFLTAGHCTEDPAVRATIWFDADVESGITENGYPSTGDVFGTTYTHPEYYNAPWYMHDLGIVKLDKPVNMDNYGALPEQGLLDQLAAEYKQPDILFTAVGYGLQKSFPTAAEWKDQADRIRMLAYPHLLQINTPGFTGDFSVLLSNNTNTGGTCFGDSGGPNFIWLDGNETNIVAGVTSFGMNPTCEGTGGVYRVDIADDLNWIYSEFGNFLAKGGKKK
jgi:secreted trypsin-like serine protease